MSTRIAFSIGIAAAGIIAAGCARSGELTDATPPDGVPIARGASASTFVITVPVALTIRPSGMAAIQACVGETVTITGNAIFLAHETILPDGTVVLDNIHINPQGAVAIGDVTGTAYRLV